MLVVLSLLGCHTVSCGGRIPVVLSAMDFSLITVVVDGRVTCGFCQVLLLQIGSQDPHNLTAFTAQFFTIVSVVPINVMLLHHGLGGTLWIQCWLDTVFCYKVKLYPKSGSWLLLGLCAG